MVGIKMHKVQLYLAQKKVLYLKPRMTVNYNGNVGIEQQIQLQHYM